MIRMRNLVTTLSAHPVVLILLLGLGLNLSGTWLLPLIDRDEPRFAEASREMLERHDLVVPTFNGAPRYDKPPLIYWAQMLSFELLGETPFAARLPSAAFATGTALLIFFWTRRLARPPTALAAALMFITCVQMAIHARLAVADMPMLFFYVTACWSGWEFTRPAARSRNLWWLIFFVSLGLGFLAKGPIAWLPLAGLWMGHWRHPREFAGSWISHALGLLLALGIVGLWGIPALLRTHGDFMRVGLGHHVVFRSFGVLEGHGASGMLGWLATAPFFLVTFFFSFFPWALRVPRALRLWWPMRNKDLAGWYLLAQAGLIFLVFTIVRTKLPHYTLPAFPLLAIWLAILAGQGLIPRLNIARWGAFMGGFIVVTTIGLGLTLRPLFLAHRLFAAAKPQLQPDMHMATVIYTEPSLVWEFRQVITNQVQTITTEEAGNFLQMQRPAVLIVPTILYESNGTNWPADVQVVTARGMNWSRGFRTELTVLIRR